MADRMINARHMMVGDVVELADGRVTTVTYMHAEYRRTQVWWDDQENELHYPATNQVKLISRKGD